MIKVSRNDSTIANRGPHKYCVEVDGQCFGGFSTSGDADSCMYAMQKLIRKVSNDLMKLSQEG